MPREGYGIRSSREELTLWLQTSRQTVPFVFPSCFLPLNLPSGAAYHLFVAAKALPNFQLSARGPRRLGLGFWLPTAFGKRRRALARAGKEGEEGGWKCISLAATVGSQWVGHVPSPELWLLPGGLRRTQLSPDSPNQPVCVSSFPTGIPTGPPPSSATEPVFITVHPHSSPFWPLWQKYHRPTGMSIRHFFLPFWRLGSPKPMCWPIWCLMR